MVKGDEENGAEERGEEIGRRELRNATLNDEGTEWRSLVNSVRSKHR